MATFARILCPVDLSAASAHAFEYAAVLARWYDAKLTVLHVCNPIAIPAVDFVPPVAAATAPELTEEELAEALRDVRDSLNLERAADVRIQPGAPARQILACAAALPADLIVIGTHGHGGFERLLLGSVTEKVVRQAPCPVLTVPLRTTPPIAAVFSRILVPTDFSETSLAALEVAYSLARQTDADVTVLHVFEWLETPPPGRAAGFAAFREAAECDARKHLDALVPQQARDWCHPRTQIARGKPHQEIVRIAQETNADAIVMGVHGHNPLDRWLFGSTTNQVVRHASCPVLTIRR